MRRTVFAALVGLAGWASLAGLLNLAGPAAAQPMPGGRNSLPPGVGPGMPSDIPFGVPPGAGTMTPEQARQQYNSLSPQQKAQVRLAAQQAKAQYGNDPALKAQAKAFLKSWRGQ